MFIVFKTYDWLVKMDKYAYSDTGQVLSILFPQMHPVYSYVQMFSF